MSVIHFVLNILSAVTRLEKEGSLINKLKPPSLLWSGSIILQKPLGGTES